MIKKRALMLKMKAETHRIEETKKQVSSFVLDPVHFEPDKDILIRFEAKIIKLI